MSHADLLERHRKVMPAWLQLYYDEPIELVSGRGCVVTDAAGRDYLDFFGGILTTMTGHSVPEVVEAVREQAGRLWHSSTLYLTRPMVELAERVAALSAIPEAKVFFVSSGTEATEAALLFCCGARRSNQVLALRNSYHGRSFTAMGVTGNRSWSASGLSPLQVSYLHNGDRRHGPFAHLSDKEFNTACAADLRQVIDTTTSGEVACLIAEPVQGVGGFIVPPDGFFAALKEVLDEEGILFVSDEVQTGWGRTGEHFWGFQAHGVTPDLITFAKGLGNGMAIAGVAGRAEIVDSVRAKSISTFGGNPLVTTAALANLEYLLSHDLQANAKSMGEQLAVGLRQLQERFEMIEDVRGKGLMIGVELVSSSTGAPSPGAANEVMEATRARGLLIGKGGLYGNVLRIAPPLSVNRHEVDQALAVLADAFDEVARGRTAAGAARERG
ncbi:MAG TPA: aspartate aminotransferase family protein [Acidimicrobiales bacterium]|nr:aspartate aminotransferase family protein [Acidimicrobiales bacterium]